MPCPIAIGGSGGVRSSSNPSTVGMKPLKASIAAGRGRPLPRPSAYVITAPCEKPPITVRSGGKPSESTKSDSSPYE